MGPFPEVCQWTLVLAETCSQAHPSASSMRNNCLIELHLCKSSLHILLSICQHNVTRVVVHTEIIDEESRPNEVVQSLHDWTSKEQHKFPLSYEHHLSLDVESLVNILKILQLKIIRT